MLLQWVPHQFALVVPILLAELVLARLVLPITTVKKVTHTAHPSPQASKLTPHLTVLPSAPTRLTPTGVPQPAQPVLMVTSAQRRLSSTLVSSVVPVVPTVLAVFRPYALLVPSVLRSVVSVKPMLALPAHQATTVLLVVATSSSTLALLVLTALMESTLVVLLVPLVILYMVFP